jgi:DNA-3-methyladenine glycosylase
MAKIPLSYYQQNDVVALSRSLIGKYLFTCLRPEFEVTGGMIIETEAYRGADDKACHAYFNRRTLRTEVMFAEGGVSYVYLCYGIHYLFNVVANQKDVADAVLIRAIRPEVGIETMIKRRKKTKIVPSLTKGPGAVCQALGITKEQNAIALDSDCLWIEERGIEIKPSEIMASPRVGVDYAGKDALRPWRFHLVC